MPTVFRQDGFRFFFYSNEGSPLEPVHVHVMKDGAEAKFWMYPEVGLARSHGFDARTLRRLAGMVETEHDRITESCMTISATDVRFDDDTMWVSLQDGRTIGVPLAWFPRLLNSSEADREAVQITAFGLHWEALDEDISVPALLSDAPRVAAE